MPPAPDVDDIKTLHIKPKFHILVHSDLFQRALGPLKHISTETPIPFFLPPPSPPLHPSTPKDVKAVRVASSGDIKIVQRLLYNNVSGLPANLPLYTCMRLSSSLPTGLTLQHTRSCSSLKYYEMTLGRAYEVSLTKAAKYDLSRNLLSSRPLVTMDLGMQRLWFTRAPALGRYSR